MTILQQPDALSLSMNLKKFIISSDAQISFVLKKGTEEVLSQRYDPDSQGRIEIDMRDVVHAQLSFDFRGSAVRTYEQTNLHAEFTAEIDGQAVNFHAVRGGVDNLADTATNFLTQNWLTWQPTVKPVTYYTPEFLTYYAPVAGVVKLRGYFVGDDGQVTSQKDIELCNVEAGKAYTIPVEYQVVVSLLYPDGKPGYYDVWVENASGERLTYIQRYYADAMRSISEDWVLFENSLGGVDCFRAYGKTNLEADHTHNLAEVDEMSEEYRVDTERKYEKNTGHLTKDEARWLLDFFPSQKKYIYVGSYLRQIVVVESNVTGNLRELPTNYTFTYKYADARPLLNLPRTDVPADMLDITIPEVGNFTIPPRLAEVPRLPLSEGDLFPVQNPYSETWSTTTAGALAEVVGQLLAAAAGTGGGVGHTHKNIDLLNLLSYVEEYLLVNGKKIKAGYADTAGSVAEGKYIRKDQPDETNYLLKLLGGVLVDGLARFGDFITGVSGAMIDKNGDAEFRSIYARKRIFTPEVAYNRVTYIKGKFIISPGGGCTVDTVTDNGDGTYTIKPDLTDADGLSQFKGDYLTTYFVTKNEEGKLTGFEEMKFIVVSSDFSAKTFVISAKPGNDWKPIENMVLAQTGNATDPDRQTYTIIDVTNGNNCITFFEHANTWDPEPAQMPGWLGKKKGMVINGINCDNYSAVLQQVLITGLIFQIDEITGESVRVPIWKGEWVKDKKYGYFNEVSHKGSRYLCINPEGTEEEPGTGQDWLITVEKGQQGDPGLSVVGGGHWEASKTPYAANTLVTMFNCVFISNVETSNPPLAIMKFKDGSYARTKLGYILAGRSADFAVHPDWTMLLDGRELKGTSITFLGSFATAPSNPVEGNSYYNTTDKCTYIYQNGQWMLMVSDGKDGRDYEYIYTRNNSIGITPDKPDSKQQDDYVPDGWTDDYLGVSETFQVEWGCKRTKRDGVWSEWSDPAIVHRWSKDGEDGKDGTSIEAVGHWEASKVPYRLNQLVNFGRGTFVALEETSEPPLPIARFKDGTYMRKKDGGYILAGRSADMTVNPSWRMMSWSDEAETLYWLDCPISAFSYTSTGSPSPSSVEVTCKMSRGGSVSDCVTLWLAARRYNGSWVAHVGATQSSKISVPATAGYTQFVVRAYKSSSDASAWNSNYVAERGIGVAQAGKDGTDYEYIFQRTTTNERPSTPATAQQDDYVPSGWTDDPQGVSETYPYEWASMRTKNDGTWGAFCTPYAYGVKGEKGDIGNTGATGAFPYYRGVFKSGQSYVWNAERRDMVIHLIGGVYYNFLVKNYGATVTAAPTSASGDSNWEAMQKFESIVTDTFLADGANIGGFIFKLKGYTSDGIPYGELRSQQADGNDTPNFYVDTQTGKVYACVAEIKGTIEASSGKIGGLQISGNSLTNINGNNDAGIYLRNSTEGTFAAMGGNVVPAVGGFTMIADFENTKRYDLTDISSINYGVKLLAQNARTNIALTIDGGCVQGFAMRNTFINTGVTSRTLTRNDYNVICNNTNECTITLPSMQLYDDGHVIRIKRLNGNVLVKTSYCYVIDPETYTSKYVRPIIIYSDSQAVTGSSSNNLTMNTKGDGTELVWVRDYIGTINGTTYYGAWIANKVSYM